MSITEIIALATAITALIAAVATGLKSRSDNLLTARRDELAALRTTIDELTERNTLLYTRVRELEDKMETERQKRRELEAVVLAKDKRISDLECEVIELQRQVKELGGTPRKRKATGNTAP